MKTHVKKGDEVEYVKGEYDKKSTKPPTRFTSSTLLAGMKDIHKYVKDVEVKKKLKDIYGYEIPSDHTGECWAISAHKNGDCTIADGEYKGKTLSWLFENHRELFGNIEGDQFPLLVKIIDAKNDLSVQVHPDDVYAKEHENSLGKTECWYVLETEENTKMVMGHHAKTKEELVQAIENDDLEVEIPKYTINHASENH